MRLIEIVSVLCLGISACKDQRTASGVSTSSPAESATFIELEGLVNGQSHRVSKSDLPAQGKINPIDNEISLKIRRKLVNSRSPVDLRGVQIITLGSKVTLVGLVLTFEAKDQVERVAQSVAGKECVLNELDVEK